MNTILLIHGPNLNMLGERDKEHYGPLTLSDIETLVASEAKKAGFECKAFQSNHEGALIDFLQKESPNAAGIIVNPGALTHYSYALHDALVDTGLPAIEVHLSDINAREEWRRISVTAPACTGVVSGKKEKGYVEALTLLISRLEPRT
ncbi:3-dehydroquinate dehydratase [Candidatus Kaiserbacteria bacterium RIFCSPLOWO2_01_FULL_54_20]|uniref:3-dehydroquinate dehydratase n=1 Tax=Candidatus Kaiserbacteria bacterium RIFCSPLOWO2_01_FULL_54_20 TaxID=1798513 RepID=A0A1F6EJ59_9BACT|nr:MAG: 3-dehydroquinate dehydratase [Candidatus Kaiserbacteria bacterium RIFCSPLOWO2_01_FULL_54_20]